MAFTIKQNDTSPAILATLQDADGNAINLVGASVKFNMRNVHGSSALVSASADVTDAESGAVKYAWSVGDTSESGNMYAEFEVTYSDGAIETFPNDGYIDITVVKEIA